MTSPQASRSTLRHVGTAVAALALGLGVSACQMSSPVQTTHIYSPADGVLINAGNLEIADLLVVSEGAGAPGVVSGYAVNTGREPMTVEVSMTVDGAPQPLSPGVEVGAGDAVRLDGGPGEDAGQGGGEPVMIPQVTSLPGETLTLRVSTSAGEVVSTPVPVLAPESPYDIYGETLDATG